MRARRHPSSKVNCPTNLSAPIIRWWHVMLRERDVDALPAAGFFADVLAAGTCGGQGN